MALFSTIEKFQPFGVDNPKPVFSFKNMIIYAVKKFGNGGVHLQLDFKKSDGKIISAIGFFVANSEHLANLKAGQTIDLVATIEKSHFRGKPEIRLRILDVRLRQ